MDNEHHGDADIEETYDFPLDNEHLGGVDIGESKLDPPRKIFLRKDLVDSARQRAEDGLAEGRYDRQRLYEQRCRQLRD